MVLIVGNCLAGSFAPSTLYVRLKDNLWLKSFDVIADVKINIIMFTLKKKCMNLTSLNYLLTCYLNNGDKIWLK